MKTKFINLLLLLSLSAVATGQNITDLFRTMPPALLPGISESNKTMLLVDSGNTSVPYSLGEISKVAHDREFLHIRTSAAGDLQLKILPLPGDSAIICLIQTVCAGICDSRITFFTTEWVKLDPLGFLPTISKEIFFISPENHSDNYKYAVSLPDIYPISARFDKAGTDLLLKLHYRERLTEEQMAEINPYLKNDSLFLHWKNGSFREEMRR
ncbi:MAG: DUF3256 family protein [bacterium]|nr:DUF3256 family protein [bacterium]MDD3625370.1 DUF3256 family protein [Proteiniphilum sp.]MDD3968566.1 DUF3256 family protein [Proteiniphilum sp.]MDD4459775.1 DUF3256 family protein [Proteiniphilum sp.]